VVFFCVCPRLAPSTLAGRVFAGLAGVAEPAACRPYDFIDDKKIVIGSDEASKQGVA